VTSAARSALLARLLLALLAVTLLLAVWRPRVVPAQGRPGMVPAPGGAKAAASLAAQTAGVPDARAKAPPMVQAGAVPSTSRPQVNTAAPGDRGAATTVPYRGALLLSASPMEGLPDTARLDFRPQVGKELAPRVGGTIGLATGDDIRAARLPGEGFTVFHRDLPDPVEAERRTRALLAPNVPAPRHGEYHAAPFATDGARLAKAPVVGTGRITLAQGEPFPRRFRVDDQVPLYLPPGVTVAVGDRLAPVVPMGEPGTPMRVVVPAGVVEVVHVGARSARAVVRSQSGTITEGQPLLPVVGEASPWQHADPDVGDPLRAAVHWIEDASRLPSPQGYVLLAAGEAEGVRAGDRFALYRRAGSSERPEEMVAQVRVVRVDRATSSAKIIHMLQAAIPPDVVALRIARPAPLPAVPAP
jgi:hypothetical protein